MAPTAISGGGRGRRRRTLRPISDINVTPLVDVMLVLLIVFMVTAPLLSAGVPVDLPQADVKPLALTKAPITVTIGNDGKIFVKDEEVTVEGLAAKLKAVAPDGAEERIYVRGDKTASYGAIMKVMGTISGAGFTHIALVALTDTEG